MFQTFAHQSDREQEIDPRYVADCMLEEAELFHILVQRELGNLSDRRFIERIENLSDAVRGRLSENGPEGLDGDKYDR